MKKKLLAITLLTISGGLILSNVGKTPNGLLAEDSNVLIRRATGTLEEEKEKAIEYLTSEFNTYPIYKTLEDAVSCYNNYVNLINAATSISEVNNLLKAGKDALYDIGSVYWDAALTELREFKKSIYNSELESMPGYSDIFSQWDGDCLTPVYMSTSVENLEGMVEWLKSYLEGQVEPYDEAKRLLDFIDEFLSPFEYSDYYQSILDNYFLLFNDASDKAKELVGSNQQIPETAKLVFTKIELFMTGIFVDYKDELTEEQINHVYSEINYLCDTITLCLLDVDTALHETEEFLLELEGYLDGIRFLNNSKVAAKAALQDIVDSNEYLSSYEGIQDILDKYFDQIDAADEYKVVVTVQENGEKELDDLLKAHELEIYIKKLQKQLEDWVYSHEVAIGNEEIAENLSIYKVFISMQPSKETADMQYESAINNLTSMIEALELAAAKESAKQEIEDYLASLDQSSWTEEQKAQVQKDKKYYFNRIDNANSKSKVDSIKKEALNKLAKFAPTEEPAEKGCNKGTAVIVIISLVAIIGITLGISLSVGKKGKKEVKKSKK